MDDVITAATAMFLDAVHGELERFKKCAEGLNRLIGDGIAATVENTEDDDGKRVIHAAAAGGNVEVLKYLIEEIKLDVDVKDNSGVTPLSWAAIEGRLAAMEYLLEMGANPEMSDDSNSTPLHHAAMKGHKDVIPLWPCYFQKVLMWMLRMNLAHRYNMLPPMAYTILLKFFWIMVPIQIWSSLMHLLHFIVFIHLFIHNLGNALFNY
ncbi:hypothetical protein MKX01_006943 [Papaver californicum]|nr:hypothetical protein MKX01_006943 [Papaver californicum]